MTDIVRRFTPAIFHPSIFDDIFRDVDDMFDKYKTNVPYNVKQITDKEGNVTSCKIDVALAGYDKNDIKINVVDDSLQITVDKADKAIDEEGVDYAHRGISQRSIQLRFKLGGLLDKKRIESAFKNGLLTVDIPAFKKEVIEIKVD